MLDQAQRRQYCLGFRAWSPEAGCQMLTSCWCVALRLHDSGDRMSRTRCRFAECGAHVGQLFLALKNKATTGKSVHGKSMPHLYSFVLKTTGGTDPFLLNETETFVRLHSPSTRSLGPGFWEKVSADVKGSNQFPRFRHAMATSCTFMHAVMCHIRMGIHACWPMSLVVADLR